MQVQTLQKEISFRSGEIGESEIVYMGLYPK
jgi:hypothetical protein